MRKMRAAEGFPGVLDSVAGIDFHLFGAHRERTLRGVPGEIIATRNGAFCRATVDGAVWITHLKPPKNVDGFKLPAVRALALGRRDARRAGGRRAAARADPVRPHLPRDLLRGGATASATCYFDFYNGAMSTEQCRRLREAYVYARSRRTTRAIVLMGGEDFFSNGIHLNVIEAAADQGEESWFNLHAIDDIVREILETDSHLVISALCGDAAAGGVPFARRGRPRGGAQGRRPEPVLPAHGRPLRLRVLDLHPPAPRGRRADGAS